MTADPARAVRAATSEARPLLTVRSLSVFSPSGPLVTDISFTVGREERVGVIGESGSGKSLTALALMGLQADDLTVTGSATFDGVQLIGAAPRRMRALRGNRMAMVFQEPMTALNPTMRVGEQIAETLREHSPLGGAGVRARTRALLAEMQVPEPDRAALAYPHQLSGGQRQRVVLAIALANDPELLICDEPTTALDVTVQAAVLDRIVSAAKARGSSLVFISHDIAVVGQVCERILVLKDGALVEAGTTAQILEEPHHPYTRELVTAAGWGEHRRVDPHRAQVRSRVGGIAGPGGQERSRAAIRVQGVVREYRRSRGVWGGRPHAPVRALDGVSFEVPQGQRLGIVGESGCGKSTVLRLIAGLDHPDGGFIEVGGERISNVPERRLRRARGRLQMIFQDPGGSLDPRMRVGQIVAEPLAAQSRTHRDTRVAGLLRDVGLDPGAAERYPHEFSGGERQRIAIARALAPDPSILLADEAVSALDVTVRAQILDLLTGLADRLGLTLVFVSHDLFVVQDVCERVLVMQAGRVVEDGDARTVYRRPHHPYTQRLVASVPGPVAPLPRRARGKRVRGTGA